MPLFVGDFLAATAEWSGEERAAYLLLLAYSWSLGSLPADEARAARLCGWSPKAFAKVWPTVRAKFDEQDGRLYNRRLEEHRAHSREISNRRAIAGANGAAKTNGNGAAIAENLPKQPEPASINQSSSKTPKPPRKSAGTKIPIPEDFGLTPERKAYAEQHLTAVDAEALMATFRSMALAKGWVYADWDQHWQTLVRQWNADSGHWSAGQYPRRVNGGLHSGVVMR
jgi:uncharacterized protein YdaU (DUF1376 family)